MEARLQQINDDTVLEITETVASKTRLSEKTLLRQKQYFEEAIAKFQSGLEDVTLKLSQIHVEQEKAQRK